MLILLACYTFIILGINAIFQTFWIFSYILRPTQLLGELHEQTVQNRPEQRDSDPYKRFLWIRNTIVLVEHIRTHTHTHTHKQAHTHARTHTRTHTQVRTHTHAHARTHTYTRAHTHTHTHIFFLLKNQQSVILR